MRLKFGREPFYEVRRVREPEWRGKLIIEDGRVTAASDELGWARGLSVDRLLERAAEMGLVIDRER